jgi:two-component system chemotaxis response regulator CheB
MLSSLTEVGAPATIKALELGAVDFVTKPAPPAVGVGAVEAQLLGAVRAAAHAQPRTSQRAAGNGAGAATGGALGHGARPKKPSPPVPGCRADRVLAIGCSTGGPRALMELVPKLPANLPAAVLIVQHMPAGFTRSLAARLDGASALHVKEAAHGDIAGAGLVLLAPGGRHMELDVQGRVVLTDDPPVHGVRPSVDVLFRTLPAVFGSRCVAAVLTGMGSDGADGAALLRAAGGRIVVEDESTCVVYGMPRAVAERGLADTAVPIQRIASVVTDLVLAQSEVRNGRSRDFLPPASG